jgi:hypothetical protein
MSAKANSRHLGLQAAADPHQRLVGVGERELVGAPRLFLGPSFAGELACKGGGDRVDIVRIEIEPKRIATRNQPVVDGMGEVQLAPPCGR